MWSAVPVISDVFFTIVEQLCPISHFIRGSAKLPKFCCLLKNSFSMWVIPVQTYFSNLSWTIFPARNLLLRSGFLSDHHMTPEGISAWISPVYFIRYPYNLQNLSIHPSIHQSIHPYIYLSIHQSIHISIYLSIYVSIYVSIYLSIYLSHDIPFHICTPSFFYLVPWLFP